MIGCFGAKAHLAVVRPFGRACLAVFVGLLVLGVPCASAQTASASAADGPMIALELNRAEDAADACRLTFVASNGTDRTIEQLTLEIVLFDTAGLVERITAFSFGAMASGKTVVRQFAVPDARCQTLGRVLINGVATCKADGLSPDTCQSLLRTKARGDLQFGL